MRRLNKAVLAGGVVYPAGAAGSEVEAAVKNPAHWDGEPALAQEPTAPSTAGDAPAVEAADEPKPPARRARKATGAKES